MVSREWVEGLMVEVRLSVGETAAYLHLRDRLRAVWGSRKRLPTVGVITHPDGVALARGVVAGDAPPGVLADWLDEHPGDSGLTGEPARVGPHWLRAAGERAGQWEGRP